MKKTLLIIGGIGLLSVLLLARLLFRQSSGMAGEREWFAKESSITKIALRQE
ncbi:MAG: hypothetical protein WEB30_13030 [Cyclobacteriaceae bacterium]